jgi:hypothetical protein
MPRHEPLGGDSYDAGQAQEGNRPAHNARLTTPGSLSTHGYQGGEGASDFLGLDAEVSGSSSAFGMMAQAHAEPEAAPEPSAWVETESSRAPSAGVRDTAFRRAADAVAAEPQDEEPEAQEEADLHGSWSEDAPRRGKGKLVGALAGVLVLGALGVAGMKFLGATAEEPASAQPLAANPRPQPAQASVPATPVAVEDGSASSRSAVGPAGAPSALQPVEDLAGSAAPSVDPEAAREAFEATRGDEPPVWFDPTLDSEAEPASTGWSQEAEAVTRASTFIGDPIALLVADGTASQPAQTSFRPLTEEETSGAAIVGSVALVAMSDAESSGTTASTSSAAAEPLAGAAATIPTSAAPDESVARSSPSPAAPSVTLAPPGESVATASASVAVAPVAVVAADSASVPAASAGEVGPAAPTEGTLLPADGAVAAFAESRQSRTSTIKVEDVLLAPTLDASNLRKADAKDLSGVWNETSVPMEAMASKTKVLTPNVGRVRVILTSKDIFEGRLYAVGQGSVWLESEYGRISVDGKRIASVANLDTKEGTPALGSAGSQNLNGLERVRIKTPGGTFYGKVIARDDAQTTIMTEEGSRLTLSNADVEILTDAPKVTIGGKVDGTPKQP